MTVADAQLAFPFILLAIGIIAVLGPSFTTLIVVIGLSGWVSYARILRSQVLGLRSREFVDAIHALGGSVLRIMWKHVLPNVLSSLVVIATLELARAIVLEATLSFLGLGIQPPTPSWGGMVQEGREYLDSAWWISTFPGVVLMADVARGEPHRRLAARPPRSHAPRRVSARRHGVVAAAGRASPGSRRAALLLGRARACSSCARGPSGSSRPGAARGDRRSGRSTAMFAAGACGVQSYRAALSFLVFELVRQPPPPAGGRMLLEHPIALDPKAAWLMRCDRVDFAPGGVAPRHRHRGGGIRCLLRGSLMVTVGDVPGPAHAAGRLLVRERA